MSKKPHSNKIILKKIEEVDFTDIKNKKKQRIRR
jgi:hypothetical protein